MCAWAYAAYTYRGVLGCARVGKAGADARLGIDGKRQDEVRGQSDEVIGIENAVG